MDIKRIGGGIEYRQSLTTPVFPNDRDTYGRAVQSGRIGSNQPAQTTSRIQEPGMVFTSAIFSQNERRLANENALAFLRYLGDLEAAGGIRDYAGLISKDNYAGGFSGVIDILI